MVKDLEHKLVKGEAHFESFQWSFLLYKAKHCHDPQQLNLLVFLCAYCK